MPSADRASNRQFQYDSGVGRLASIILLGVAACTSPVLRTVPRVVDGELEHGPFVSPYAYEWFIEGEASASKGQHDQAAMAFENAAAAPADDELLMTRLAEEYELSGESRRADRTLNLARRAYPRSPRVAFAEGRLAQYRGKDDEAIAAFLRARELGRSWDAPVIALAETLAAAGHEERASAILLEYLTTSLDAGSERVRQVLVELARRRGDAETLGQAIAFDPRSTPAGRAIEAGRLALGSGQPALAARIFAASLDTPENVTLWVHALMQSGDREEAALFLRRVDSERLGGLSEHVALLLEIDEAAAALALLQSAERTAKLESAKGRALLAHGDYLQAAAVLSEVPLGAASFEDARIALAQCSISQGRLGAAAETLSQAPHHSLAIRETLAEIYLGEGTLASALRLFDPKRDLERAALASVFERAGHFEEAAAYYAAVNATSSDEARLRARASAERLASRGNRKAAIAVLDRWTAAAPDDLYARVRLIELLAADDQVEVAQKSGRRTLGLINEPLLRAHLLDVLQASAATKP